MVALDEVVKWLDGELKTSSIEDYPGAMNGLQLANISLRASLNDACDSSIRWLCRA